MKTVKKSANACGLWVIWDKMSSPVQQLMREVGVMRVVLSLCIIGLLSGAAFAQDNPSQLEKSPAGADQIGQIKNDLGNLLFAPLMKDRAWAAYHVGKLGLKEH